jgi:hypothetical protein
LGREPKYLEDPCHRWLRSQRDLVGGHGHRDTESLQGSLDTDELVAIADEHCEATPRDPVESVCATHGLRDVLGAGRGGVEALHPDFITARTQSYRCSMTAGDIDPEGGVGRRWKHGTHRGADAGTESSRAPEDHDGCRSSCNSAESIGEVHDAAKIGASEGIDGLIRIADGDQGRRRRREVGQQPRLQRVGVLVLVYVDRAVALDQSIPHGCLTRELDRTTHQLGVVLHVLQSHHLEVGFRDRCDR